MGEITYIDAVREYMMQNGDGEQILDDYPIISAAIMVKDAHAAIDKAGIKDSIVERIVHSVVPTIEAVTAKVKEMAKKVSTSYEVAQVGTISANGFIEEPVCLTACVPLFNNPTVFCSPKFPPTATTWLVSLSIITIPA